MALFLNKIFQSAKSLADLWAQDISQLTPEKQEEH